MTLFSRALFVPWRKYVAKPSKTCFKDSQRIGCIS